MTFLELCRRLRSDAGISGTGPDSVLGQTAILAKVVEWVRSADVAIQRARSDWGFMWQRRTASLTGGVRDYSLTDLGIGDVARLDSLHLAGLALNQVAWETWLTGYDQRSAETGTPARYSVAPDGRIYLHPTPDAPMTLQALCYRAPTPMTANADESLIPAVYREVIVARALMDYAHNESDTELYQMASVRYRALYTELCNRFLPQIKVI